MCTAVDRVLAGFEAEQRSEFKEEIASMSIEELRAACRKHGIDLDTYASKDHSQLLRSFEQASQDAGGGQ